MQYDPIKRSLGKVFSKTPLLRICFYRMLDVLLLRAWHIKGELRRWRKTAPKGASILDAGAGFGQYVYHVSTMDKSFTVLGVDVKEEQIADCNAFFAGIGQAGRVKFEYADLTKFRRPGSFDLVMSVDVMEHIEDDVAVFQNVCESLKEGGMMLISTPSDQGGSDVHDEHEEGFVDEHVRDGYNIGDIKQKLSRAGFSRVEARYSYGCPGKISWKLTMKFPILMLNASKVFFVVLPFYYVAVMLPALLLNWRDVCKRHETGTGLIVKAWK